MDENTQKQRPVESILKLEYITHEVTQDIPQAGQSDSPQEAQQTSFQESQREQTPVFPSAFLLLECARDEYSKERERTQFLDNKSSFFMSAIILVATIFVPFIPFDQIRKAVISGSDVQRVAVCILGTLVAVSFAFLVIAFKNLYDAYKIKGYERFNIENLIDITILTADKNHVEKGLCQNYKETIEKNIKKNDDKADSIAAGLRDCAIGFLLLAASAIILVCFIG